LILFDNHTRPITGDVHILLIWGKDGTGPAVQPFGDTGRQVDTAVAARMSIIVVPVGAVEGMPGAREERAPRHTGQVVDVRYGVAEVRHVYGRSLVIGAPFAFGRICAALSAGTADGHYH